MKALLLGVAGLAIGVAAAAEGAPPGLIALLNGSGAVLIVLGVLYKSKKKHC